MDVTNNLVLARISEIFGSERLKKMFGPKTGMEFLKSCVAFSVKEREREINF
jgi:hypothetical protein